MQCRNKASHLYGDIQGTCTLCQKYQGLKEELERAWKVKAQQSIQADDQMNQFIEQLEENRRLRVLESAALASTNEQNVFLRQSLDHFNQALAIKQAEIDRKEIELSDLNKNLKREVGKMETEITELTTKLKLMEANLESREEQNKELQSRIHDLKQKVLSLEDVNTELQDKEKFLLVSISEKEALIDQQQAKLAHLEQNIEKLSGQQEDSSKTIEELQRQLHLSLVESFEQKETIFELEAQIEKRNWTNNQLVTELLSKQTEVQQMHEINEQLEEDKRVSFERAAQQEAFISELKSVNAQVEEQNVVFASENETFKNENFYLKSLLRDSETERRELTMKVENLRNSLFDSDSRQTSLSEQNALLYQNVDYFKQLLAKKHVEMDQKEIQLSTTIEKLQSELANLKAEVVSSRVKLQRMEATLETQEAQNNELQARNHVLNEEVLSLKARNTELQEKEKSLLEQSRKDHDDLTSKLKAVQQEAAKNEQRMEANLENREEQNKELQSRIHDLKQKVLSLEDVNTELQDKEKFLLVSISEKEALIDQQQAKVAHLEQNIEKLSGQQEDSSKTIEELQRQLHLSSVESFKQNETILELEAQIEEHNWTNNQVVTELQSKQTEVQQMHEINEQLEENKRVSLERAAQQEAFISELKSVNAQVETEITTLRAKLELMEGTLESREAENNELQAMNQVLNEEVLSLKARNTELQEKEKSLLEQSRKDHDDLTSKLKAVQQEAAKNEQRMEANLETREEQNIELQSRIHDLKQKVLSLEDVNTELQDKEKFLLVSISEKEALIDQQQAKVAHLEQNIEKLSGQQEDSSKTIEELQHQLDLSSVESFEQKKTILELEAQIEKRNWTTNQVVTELQSKQTEVQQMHEINDQLEEDKRVSLERAAQQEAFISELKSVNAQVETEITTLRAKLELMGGTLESREAENNELQAMNQVLNEEVLSLKARNTELQEKEKSLLEQSRKDHDDLTSKLKAVQQEAAKMQSIVREKEALINLQQAKLAELEQNIEMLSSAAAFSNTENNSKLVQTDNWEPPSQQEHPVSSSSGTFCSVKKLMYVCAMTLSSTAGFFAGTLAAGTCNSNGYNALSDLIGLRNDLSIY
ncbi:putative leucine-rich repeat-containing protein DDB_G0290503 [Boleophthalmus pectinirostris]|uniref:putative leucine-rich repeat-containing protein DDB_G0290503 n=1 Tax=Boleophthalmus pectinirostris TaxID=150288 RepID=UPI00243181FE|nr:putative leucine-rich repeat-containing protein DDB_G0290503 [Boleophthalmus pectinirostris]